MTPSLISCQLHDYIEIACMYGYQIKLELKNGQTIQGKALDIHTSSDKREYLIFSNPVQKTELNQIAKLTVLTPNSRFNKVIFSEKV